MVRTQSHLITCQCTSVQGLSLLQLALVADEIGQFVIFDIITLLNNGVMPFYRFAVLVMFS